MRDRLSFLNLCQILAILLLFAFRANAQEPTVPKGPVILTISGAINVGQELARFDRESLEALGLEKVVTQTPWTDGQVEFEGVLARDVLERVNATGEVVRATALNDYAQEIPVSDFINYDVIIASRINGHEIKVRENGPLWIIYPWTDNPELNSMTYHARSVWQLSALKVIVRSQ